MGLTTPVWQGFPGEVHAAVTYALSGDADALELRIEFEATAESPTPVNMAQHSYFNLEGAASGATILNHTLQINSCGSCDESSP